MAQNSPAVFNVHVRGFIDVIWNALRFHNREIRESAVEALSVRPPLSSHTAAFLHLHADETCNKLPECRAWSGL